jgi:hypothetical protein
LLPSLPVTVTVPAEAYAAARDSASNDGQCRGVLTVLLSVVRDRAAGVRNEGIFMSSLPAVQF